MLLGNSTMFVTVINWILELLWVWKEITVHIYYIVIESKVVLHTVITVIFLGEENWEAVLHFLLMYMWLQS